MKGRIKNLNKKKKENHCVKKAYQGVLLERRSATWSNWQYQSLPSLEATLHDIQPRQWITPTGPQHTARQLPTTNQSAQSHSVPSTLAVKQTKIASCRQPQPATSYQLFKQFYKILYSTLNSPFSARVVLIVWCKPVIDFLDSPPLTSNESKGFVRNPFLNVTIVRVVCRGARCNRGGRSLFDCFQAQGLLV